MKSTWDRLSSRRSVSSPVRWNTSQKSAVITIATGKPISSALLPRRIRSRRRSTTPTASAASGPNSGPSTIAPTTVTGELDRADRGEQAGDAEEGQEADGQPGVLPGPRDQLVPDHRVGRVAGHRRLRRVRRVGQHGVDGFQGDAAGVVHTELGERLQDVVGALPGEDGL